MLLFSLGCSDGAQRPTTLRPDTTLQPQDGLGQEEGGTSRPEASHQATVGAATQGMGAHGDDDSGEAVPSGLDMRSDPKPSPRPSASIAQSGGGTNPRTLPPPWIGGPQAKVIIEEFSNFECPFCIQGARTMKMLLDHFGPKIKIIYRHLPLAYQPQARLAAQAAVCAQAQGRFWDMKALLFANYRDLSRADLVGYARRLGLDVARFTRDLDSGACLPRVEADIKEARKRVIEGTPAYFINGEKHEGALPLETFRELIHEALTP